MSIFQRNSTNRQSNPPSTDRHPFFCIKTRISCFSTITCGFAMKRAFLDKISISPIAANLPWMHYSNGPCCDVWTLCRWQHVGKNLDIPIYRVRISYRWIVDADITSPHAHAHAHNVNIHIPSHASRRSWFLICRPAKEFIGVNLGPIILFIFYLCIDVHVSASRVDNLSSRHDVQNGENPFHFTHPLNVLWHRGILRTVSDICRRTFVDESCR